MTLEDLSQTSILSRIRESSATYLDGFITSREYRMHLIIALFDTDIAKNDIRNDDLIEIADWLRRVNT